METVLDIAPRVHDVAVGAAQSAGDNDKQARFPRAGVDALGKAGLMGLTVPVEQGGLGQGARAIAEILPAIAQADASLGMVYMMHMSGVACLQLGKQTDLLEAAAKGQHLTTLAFSESGSRSHFWAPVSQAQRNAKGVILNADKSFVTSAGEADSYVVTTQAVEAGAPTESTLYAVDATSKGIHIASAWDGMGLRGNASAPMRFEDCHVDDTRRLTEEGAGFDAKIGTVLPVFNLSSACVSLGICQATVEATTRHLQDAKFEHLGASLGEALPTLRAQLAQMAMRTHALADVIHATAASIEEPDESTQGRVLEVKAIGNETALDVTRMAMRVCGGAAYAKHVAVERNFRDAHAGAIMAPTADVLYDLLAKARLGLPLF